MRLHIGNRVHLDAFITGLYDYDNTTRKFADVLSGKKTRVTLGYPEIAAAKSFGVSLRTKIVLKRSYALHMDNSGHFTGLGYGKNGHRDPYPLTIRQVSLIPEIIKTIHPQSGVSIKSRIECASPQSHVRNGRLI